MRQIAPDKRPLARTFLLTGVALLALRIGGVGTNLYVLRAVATDPDNSASWAQMEIVLSFPSLAFGVLVLLLTAAAARLIKSTTVAGLATWVFALLCAIAWLVSDVVDLTQHPGWLVARALAICVASVVSYRRFRETALP